MKIMTKAEKDSAMFHATVSHRSSIAKKRIHCKPIRIKLSDLPTKEYNQLLKIIETYGKEYSSRQNVL